MCTLLEIIRTKNKASEFFVDCKPISEFRDDPFEIYRDQDEYKRLCDWFHKSNVKKKMKRGDVLRNDAMCAERNEGLFIYDGKTLVYPYNNNPFLADSRDDGIDEFGYVPIQFLAITEFPVRHWCGIVEHNSYIYADLSCFDLEFTEFIEKQVERDTIMYAYFAHFTHKDIHHGIFHFTSNKLTPTKMSKIVNKVQLYDYNSYLGIRPFKDYANFNQLTEFHGISPDECLMVVDFDERRDD